MKKNITILVLAVLFIGTCFFVLNTKAETKAETKTVTNTNTNTNTTTPSAITPVTLPFNTFSIYLTQFLTEEGVTFSVSNQEIVNTIQDALTTVTKEKIGLLTSSEGLKTISLEVDWNRNWRFKKVSCTLKVAPRQMPADKDNIKISSVDTCNYLNELVKDKVPTIELDCIEYCKDAKGLKAFTSCVESCFTKMAPVDFPEKPCSPGGASCEKNKDCCNYKCRLVYSQVTGIDDKICIGNCWNPGW